MQTNQVYYTFYSADVPQQEIEDPKMRKCMLAIGAFYLAIILLLCVLL
ncbi:MAG: hypothetical protein MJZ14_05400 [Paludibacteraceae bacterium]|nr:hypothetical protein [Paludibacteraceae bacterium]